MDFDISLLVPGLPFNEETFYKNSLGGSETAGFQMATELGKLGCHVNVFCNGEPMQGGHANYLPLEMWKDYVQYTPHDIAIVQRLPAMFGRATPFSRANFLWQHDLAMIRSEHELKGTSWNIDKVLVLSDFMREQYKEVYHLPDEMLYKTRNGVDLELVARSIQPAILRDRFLLVYAARPERGLDVMLDQIMPLLLAKDKRFKLAICTYDNPADHMNEFLAKIEQSIKKLGDNVVKMGALSKTELYALYSRAGAYVYPTPSPFIESFREVSCISVMEAQACGLPVITTDCGALSESLVPSAGILLDVTPKDPSYAAHFVEQILRLQANPVVWADMSAAGMKHAESLSWKGVAEDWVRLFEETLRAKSSSPSRLARHFWRRSDIYAAEVAAQRIEDAAEKTRVDALLTPWNFIHEEEGFRKQYEMIGATHDPSVFPYAAMEPRYEVLRDWVLKRPDVKNVVDYGCAHGSYSIHLANDTEVDLVIGLDVDCKSVEMANRFVEEHLVRPKTAQFAVYDATAIDEPVDNMPVEGADLLVMFEVLEHVAKPWEVIQRMERTVRHGGTVLITVPFGPWEYESYLTYPHRCHIWEFDLHDIRDMLKDKSGVSISAMPGKPSPQLGTMQGWYFIEYTVDHSKPNAYPINMERKQWLQAPRETVSVNMMAGETAEETLHWCLKSTQHVADQLVIVDCGMTDEGRRIAAQYGAEIVPGVDPKRYGFETPRNMGLEQCVMDWALWIDTDEKLIQPECLTKYMRPNVFNGYSIRQNHFAVDTTFSADMPVRMFRRNSGMKFFGMIHEHPETELNAGPGLVIVVADVDIAHVGYLVESGRKKRFNRNYPLLQADIAKYPERILQKQFIMRDNMLLCGYELQKNGTQVTPELRVLARETVELYRKYFLGKTTFTSSDPINYYTQAMQLLGEGFEVLFSMSADKVAAKQNGTLIARFASVDEAMLEINKRSRDKMEHLDSEYY